MTQAGTSTLAYNSANELCWTLPTASANTCGSPPTGSTAYGFDTRGNRTSAVPSTGAATCDAYDQADRLTAITAGTGSSCTSPTTVGTYTYNSSGLRMSKTVGSTTTVFAWNLAGTVPTLLQERVSGGGVTDYIYGPNGTPLEQISGSSVLLYHTDQLGSTRVLTDTSGTVKATYRYDAYGNLTSMTGSVANPFLFAGQYKDAESGLYYLQARYYDPTTGQFTTRDPMVAATGEPYTYVSGNPVNGSDPSGLHVACGGADNSGGGAGYSGTDSCAQDLPSTGDFPANALNGSSAGSIAASAVAACAISSAAPGIDLDCGPLLAIAGLAGIVAFCSGASADASSGITFAKRPQPQTPEQEADAHSQPKRGNRFWAAVTIPLMQMRELLVGSTYPAREGVL
jgi:RHS repeat-associated protein